MLEASAGNRRASPGGGGGGGGGGGVVGGTFPFGRLFPNSVLHVWLSFHLSTWPLVHLSPPRQTPDGPAAAEWLMEKLLISQIAALVGLFIRFNHI